MLEDVPINQPRLSRHRTVVWWFAGGCAALLIILGSVFYYFSMVDTSLVPKNIRQSVSFPVYYPDPKKLPSGYALNRSSFTTPQKGVVLYTVVAYGKNKHIIISVQQIPSADEIQRFYTNYIPLRNHVHTSHGIAEVGAYKNGDRLQTVASISIPHGAWVIITAPPDIDQTQLEQLLSSLRS